MAPGQLAPWMFTTECVDSCFLNKQVCSLCSSWGLFIPFPPTARGQSSLTPVPRTPALGAVTSGLLGTQRAHDKGCPSGPLTPSLRALPAGRCPHSCLLSSGSSQPRRRLHQPLAGSQTVRPRPLPAGPAPQPVVPRLSNCHPEARSGPWPLSGWWPPPPGSASRRQGDTELGEALGNSRLKAVCPRGLST